MLGLHGAGAYALPWWSHCCIGARRRMTCPECLARLGSHGAGAYALPGGHLEMGESWEVCAAREVLEETGLEVSGLRFETAVNSIFAPKVHYVTILMRGNVDQVLQTHSPICPFLMAWLKITSVTDCARKPHNCHALGAQDAVPAVLEPDKCEAWLWVPYTQVPKPVFLPLEQLLDSGYSPYELASLASNKSQA